MTIHGIVVGGMITVISTAANVYLSFKAGLTFTTSIPATVVSMVILHCFRDHSVQENDIA